MVTHSCSCAVLFPIFQDLDFLVVRINIIFGIIDLVLEIFPVGPLWTLHSLHVSHVDLFVGFVCFKNDFREALITLLLRSLLGRLLVAQLS